MNMDEKMTEDLKKLVRSGIGTRSITQFASETGLSRGYVSRIVNGKLDSAPTRETLRALAEHMKNVTFNELLSCCGYEPISPESAASDLYRDIVEAFEKLDKTSPFISLDEIVKKLELKGAPSFHFCDERDDAGSSWAEKNICLVFETELPEHRISIRMRLFFSRTEGGKILLYNVEEEPGKGTFFNKDAHAYIYPQYVTKHVEKRLLSAIFGDSVTITNVGFGFHFDENTDITEFLLKNASHCKTKELSLLFQKVADGSDTIGDPGKCVAILLTEITGKPFAFYPETEHSPACIISKITDPSELLKYQVCETAKLLKIKTFGTVVYSYEKSVEECEYDTDTFYYAFKK